MQSLSIQVISAAYILIQTQYKVSLVNSIKLVPTPMTYLIFWITFISTAIMVGVIWVIQLVHYPFFHHLKRDTFQEYMTRHRAKISMIVVPVMIVELSSAVALLFSDTFYQTEFIVGLILLAGIWGSTIFLQMPIHQKIAVSYKQSQVEKLIRTNWIRTWCWTLRLALLLYVLRSLSFTGLF